MKLNIRKVENVATTAVEADPWKESKVQCL